MKLSDSKRFQTCAAYMVVHVLAHVSARWFEVTPGISIWYVPGGLALALMTLLGLRYLPLVFLVNLATAWFPAPPVEMWMVGFFPLLIATGYGAAAWVVRRYMNGRLLPGDPRQTLGLCSVVGLAPLGVAVIGTAVYHLMAGSGYAPQASDFWPSVLSWWIGDASGILTVVPAIMVFVAPWLAGDPPAVDWKRLSAGRLSLAAIRAAALIGTIVAVLTLPMLRNHDAFYICFLPLIWICVHHGLPGATLASLVVMMVGLVSMRLTNSTEPFSHVFLLFVLAVSSVGLGLGTLVSRRNEAERKLADSQARLDRVMAGAQLGSWDWDMTAGWLDFNERFAEMIGYRSEEVPHSLDWWPQLVHPVDQARVENAMKEHIDGHTELFEAEFRLRTKDGFWRWVHSRGSIVSRDGVGKPLRVSGTQSDITDRKRAEAEVGRLLRIIETTPDLVVMTDAVGCVIYANAAVLKVCGRAGKSSFALGLRLDELLSGDAGRKLMREALPAALDAGTWHGEGSIVDTAGSSIPTSQVVLAHRDEETDTFTFSVNMRDLSDQQRAEFERRQRDRELLQLQKAESLSVLAGGIAHDFNNLLTSIMGHANLATHDLAEGSQARTHIDKIEQAALRAAGLCQQMLAYAGRNPVAFAEIDLNRMITDVCGLFEAGIDKRIEVRLEMDKSLAPILAASTQMQQVVMNLVLNAAESIGANEGRVTVRTSERYFDAARLASDFPGQNVAAGSYAVLEVQDTGCGMSPETLARIFEPFFTTKFTGQGLGLAAVAGVVKSHRGAVAVRSTPGAGSVFCLAFPLPARRSPVEIVRPPVSDDKWTGTGTILVVDDDVFIKEITAQILRGFGFSTLTAGDGAEAVDAFSKHAGELVAVLLDLTMPKMDGFEAHAEMHRINPAVPVILMSGFSEKLDSLPPEAIHPAGVLAKPFGRKQLRARLASVLGTPAQTSC